MDRQLDALFVHPGSKTIYQGLYNTYSARENPTWALLLAQSCRSVGYGVDLLDCDAEELDTDKAAEKIVEHNPRLAVFIIMGSEPNQSTVRMSTAVVLAEAVKQLSPNTKIAFVGNHPSALPKETLEKHSCIDFVMPGDGVYALHNILKTDLGDDLWKVKGIGWKPWSNNGTQGAILNDPESIVSQQYMDISLPGYAWDLLPKKEKPLDLYRCHYWHGGYKQENRTPAGAIYTSLGCPMRCGFCCLEGTKIIVANGKNKKIEDVTLNDTLVSYNEATGEVVETNIVNMASREVDGYYHITLSDGKFLELTGEHPLYCDGKWVEAKDLIVGSKLLVIDSSDKISLYKKLNNPMKNEETRKKVSKSIKRKWANGEFGDVLNNPLVIAKRAESAKRFYQTEEGLKIRKAASDRMKENNPMYNSDVVERVRNTTKDLVAKGKIVPFMCTDEGKRIIGEIAKNKQSSDANPMKSPEVAKKVGEKAKVRMLGLGENHPWRKPDYLERRRKRKGETAPNWKGGYSFGDYGPEFNIYLKSFIKRRDKYICQECGFNGKGGKKFTGRMMCVHHIDYNKKNNSKCNLILLCNNCHSKTNVANRTYWEEKYKRKMVELGHEGCPHYVEVSSISYVTRKAKVYNFQCTPYDNYFANYILTHNCCINLVNRTNYSSLITAADSNIFRYWTHNHTLSQIEWLVDNGVKNIRISDEMFFLKPAHYQPLLEGIKYRWGDSLNLWAYARVDTVRPKQLELFKSAGINWLCLGIESGNRIVRKEASKGSFQDVDIVEVIREIENHGIKVISNFIVGLEGDTYESMCQTRDLALELNCHMMNVYPAMALPGTPLHKEAKEKGKQLPESYAGYGFLSYECLPLGTDTLSPADVVKFRDDMFHEYWMGEKFHNRITQDFSQEASNNIKEMCKIRLKRKLLGDSYGETTPKAPQVAFHTNEDERYTHREEGSTI